MVSMRISVVSVCMIFGGYSGFSAESNDFHTLLQKGRIALTNSNLDEAESFFRRACPEELENAAAPGQLALCEHHLGSLDDTRGRPPLNEAISVFRTAKPVDSAELAYALGALGMIDVSQGFYAQAEAKLREAEALAESSLGEEHPQVAGYQTNLALVLMLEGRY